MEKLHQRNDSSSPSRRSTRSTVTKTPNKDENSHKTESTGTNPHILSTTELNSLLCKQFPGRQAQIKNLLGLMGGPHDYMLPLLVYGGPSTGKTSVILEIFKHLNRPYAYSSCRSCFLPRLLFESVLNQLFCHKRSKSNNYGSAVKCDKVSDFVAQLKEALEKRANSKSSKGFKNTPHKKVSEKGLNDCLEVVYLVFDNIDLLLEWSNGFTLISSLFKLNDLTRMPNLGLIFISGSTPDAFFSHTGTIEPLPIYFRDYTDEELRQILLKGHSESELYRCFVNASLRPFSRATRRVSELWTALEPLYKKYCENASKELAALDEKEKRRLFTVIQPHIAPALNQVFHVPTFAVSGRGRDKLGWKSGSKRQAVDDAFQDLDFHLSVCGKYLLISAFIASRNPATLDATLFDSTGTSDGRKRRKKNFLAMEKKEIEAQEKLLKGPGSFPLERLLAIFQCITAVGDEETEKMQGDDMCTVEEKGTELTADALMQISTLCNINLLFRGSSCPLEGGCRYRCNIDDELALKIARSVNFPLSKYLYR